MKWALTVQRWQPSDWQRVLFTHESRYLFTVDGKQRVSCQRERMSACCVQVGVSWRGDGSEQERTPLIFVNENLTAQGYINDILCPTVQPFQQHGGIYQHDIARPHTTRIVLNVLRANSVNLLRGLHAGQTGPPQNTYGMPWIVVFNNIYPSSQITGTDSGLPKRMATYPTWLTSSIRQSDFAY